MESNKQYYTPDIEDLFVNYKCQFLTTAGEWENHTFVSQNGITQATFPEKFRTKYLDKEDIESLGWEFKVFGIDDFFKGKALSKDYVYDKTYPLEHWFKKGEYWLALYYRKIAIVKDSDWQIFKDKCIQHQSIYFGECKSINELRKIMKWLDIC